MSSTNKTTYYELSQYVGTDIINPLTDFNGDNEKIDTALHNIAEAASSSASDITALAGRVTTAEGKITALENQNGNDVLVTTAQTLSGAINELKSINDTQNSTISAHTLSIDNHTSKISALETKVGTATLETTAQDCSEAINELNTGKVDNSDPVEITSDDTDANIIPTDTYYIKHGRLVLVIGVLTSTQLISAGTPLISNLPLPIGTAGANFILRYGGSEHAAKINNSGQLVTSADDIPIRSTVIVNIAYISAT